MAEQVPFISREDELHFIDELIGEWGSLHILCIDAPGGIGKTRLLQEVHKRHATNKKAQLIVTDIIDFDNHAFHFMENLGRKIANMLGETRFKPYLQGLLDYRKLEMTGISPERRLYADSLIHLNFLNCFNKVAGQERIVLFFDTTDALKGKILLDYLDYFGNMGLRFKNSLIILSGRNAEILGNSLKNRLGKKVKIINLRPLQDEDSKEYLQQKQRLLHIELESDLARKLLLLAGGNPILIDLAVEWRKRGISLKWLVNEREEEFISLPDDEKKKRQEEFERQLVMHISQVRSQIDELTLLMSRVYPLDIPMMITLLEMEKEEAEELFEEAQKYVFVKILPDGRITLHDEMRRMINEYVWHEVDPNGDQRRWYSKFAAQYLENTIQNVTKYIEELKKQENIAQEKEEAEASLTAFEKREALEREIYALIQQHLSHKLYVDIDQGIETFVHAFDEATQKNQFSFRKKLLEQMQQNVSQFSDEHLYELNSRRVTHWLDMGNYLEASELVTRILKKRNITPEKRINMFILRANAEIRLGHVKKGIVDFKEAVKMSEAHNFLPWKIKSTNALGWAYRLTGDFDRAQKYYREARNLCLQEDGLNKKELQNEYGWISNNLAFVLSNTKETRLSAIDMIHSTLEHWQSIGNNIGLGAGYLVLGIAYYRNSLFEAALEAFQKALSIFEPLKLNDWLGQIYSWRGAVYQHMGKLEKAINDLEDSLKIGGSNITAMTLNRLGRVYMALEEWESAEDYIKDSLESARQIPDYAYWLVSIEKLITIAAEKGKYQRLDEFNQILQDYLKHIETPRKDLLGTARIALARLAFGQNDVKKIDTIITFLQRGIPAVVEFGSYANRDISSWLAPVEKDFYRINPEIIRSVGQALRDYISQKEIENVAYSIVTPIMYKWADWKKEG